MRGGGSVGDRGYTRVNWAYIRGVYPVAEGESDRREYKHTDAEWQ